MGKQDEQNSIQTGEQPEQVSPDLIYYNNIELYTSELIEKEYQNKSQEELKQDKSFFPRLIQYIYNNYLGDLLRNKLSYKLQKIKPVYLDIKQLDDIFDIYISLVYKYKWNNRPSILEYCILTGITRDTVYNWLTGSVDKDIVNSYKDDDRRYHITNEYSYTVAKWQTICEQALVDGNGEYVKEIFLLKAKHGYKDNNNDITVTVNHKAIVDADNLPSLLGINSKD